MISDDLEEYFILPLNDYYLCYFDVLGYKEYMRNKANSHKKYLINMLLSNGAIGSQISRLNAPFPIHYKVYSDNFLIYFEKGNVSEYDALKLLAKLMRKIQTRLLCDSKMIIRGGITIGEFYADDKIIFGEGLIRAYELESSYAKNPRIIIDPNCFKEDVSKLENDKDLLKDIDGLYYINYFYNKDFLKLNCGYIISLINTYCHYQDKEINADQISQREKVISKYLWMLIKFNEACRIANAEKLEIKYELKINERVLKQEIYCQK